MQLQEALEDLGAFQQVAALHFFAVLAEAHLPVRIERTPADGQVGEDSGDLPILGDPPQPDVGCVGQGHQDRHAASKPQQIELFENGAERTGADILDGSNALVGIHHLIADLKGHTGSPTNHRERVLFRY